MTAYSTLVDAKTVSGSIKNWMSRTDTPSASIVTEAEAYIYDTMGLRVREMEAVATLTFLIDTDSIALPSDYLDPIEYRPYSWGEELPFVHQASLEATRDSAGDLFSGTPSRWTTIGTTAYVDVSVSAAFSGKLTYYARPTALSSAETNFLTDQYPTLLRNACLMFAHEFDQNWDVSERYRRLAENELGLIKMNNELARRGQLVT